MKKRLLSLFTACLMLMSAVLPAASAENKESEIHISTVEEFRDFAQECTLDEYSVGLRVFLDADIDFENEPVYPVPTFSGSFDGMGHVLSNVILATDGSHQGLFRYLQSDGKIENLNVKGIVEPDGSASQTGGIVGTSFGEISGCVFTGTVSGINYVGGIAGDNYGTIDGCGVSGNISGKRFTGGIAGYSEGTIINCTNDSRVNTGITAGGLEIDRIDIGQLTNGKLTGAEDTDVVSDTGGIAGYSAGTVENCINNGAVGYPHYGYNVGGIAGRQAGFIHDCSNNGSVTGRKDIGGIVGQMEPYLILKRASTLADEIRILQGTVNGALANLSGQSAAVADALWSIKDSAYYIADSYWNEDFIFPDEPYIPDIDIPIEPDPETPGEPEQPSPEPDTPAEPEQQGEPLPAEPGEQTAEESDGEAAESLAFTGAEGGIVFLRPDYSGMIRKLSETEPENGQTEPPGEEQPEAGTQQDSLPEINRDKLRDDLDMISGGFDDLNVAIAGTGASLSGDLASVSGQLSKIMIMMADALSGTADRKYFNDVSENEPDNSVQGKVRSCVNSGTVEGDTDVGGIVGDMGIEYEFDLENELMSVVTANNIISSTYDSKCILQDNTNRGAVCSKKDNSGGIAGQQELGTIRGCSSFGEVRSSEGNRVGGIVGNSFSSVNKCYAMCRLDGKEYVGGICGFGTRILDCATLVDVGNVTACCGAIAGWADIADGKSVSGNLYVHRRLGAIDGISYSGKAAAVGYDELIKIRELPEEFRSLHICFTANGETVGEIPFEYGGSIDASQLPEVPKKNGYSGAWPEYDFSELYFNDTLEALYSTNLSALSAADPNKKEDRAKILVESSFDSSAKLYLNEYMGDSPDEALGITREKWVLNIDGVGAEEVYTVRFLPPEPESRIGKIELFRKTDEEWIRLDTEKKGSYLTFKASGEQLVLAAVEAEKNDRAVAVGMAAAGAAAICVTGLCLRKARKKKSAIQTEK